MNEEEFRKQLLQDLQDNLPEYIKVTETHAVKNNGIEREGVSFENQERDNSISPILYYDDAYDLYLMEDENYDDFFHNYMAQEPWEETLEVDPEILRTYPKDNIFIRVVSLDENVNLLNQIPYTREGDLLITYRVLLENDENGMYSVLLDNKLFQRYQIPLEQLHDAALENTEKLFQPRFTNLQNLLLGGMGELSDTIKVENESDKNMFFVLTNDIQVNGASTLFYPNVREALDREFPEGYHALPSSIHEWLILSKNSRTSLEELEDMVLSANGNEDIVSPAEKLSNHVYEMKDGQLEVCHTNDYDINDTLNPTQLETSQMFIEEDIDLEP